MGEVKFWLPEGEVVGSRYQVGNVLGVGGYGITYQGVDMRLGQTVAIKEYFPGFWVSRFGDRSSQVKCRSEAKEAYAKGVQRFMDEARTLVQLANIPEIVEVRDFFEENGTAYIIMEFLDGKNLKQMADGFGGRIAPDVLIPLMEPLILALEKVHSSGLIHRDISPDNIMMLEDGTVRLIDFGNARDTTNNKSMTLAMKQGFAPPEQYKSHGQGTWTDVYGLCATMYYCMTGKLPPQAMERLTGAPFPAPSEMGIEILPYQEDVIFQGLDLYVNKRIQNMHELWEKLYEPEPRAGGQNSDMQGMADQGMVIQNIEDQSTEIQNLQQGHLATEPYQKTADLSQRGGQKNRGGLKRVRDICREIFRKMKEL